MGQNPLPDTKRIPAELNIDLRSQVEAIITTQGYRAGPWYFKDAKACLTWPTWHTAFPKARWIVVRRDARQIAASCIRTGFMRAYNNMDGWLKWVAHHESCFDEMKAAGLDLWEIWPESTLNGDLTVFEDLVTELQLNWRGDEVSEFVDPGLWHDGTFEMYVYGSIKGPLFLKRLARGVARRLSRLLRRV